MLNSVVFIQQKQETGLFIAARDGNEEIVKELLQNPLILPEITASAHDYVKRVLTYCNRI